MKNVILLFFSVIVVLSFTACAQKAQIAQSWVDPAQKGYAANDILVLGVSKDEVVLKLWENVFVDQLTKLGVRTMASHKVIGHVPEPDRKIVEAAIKKTGASSVLITHMVSSKSDTYTPRGTVHFQPSGLYGGMYGYYGYAHQAVYSSPMDVTRTVVRLESNLYDAATAKLIWTAQSEALNPKLLRTDFERVARLLIADMEKNGVVQ